MKSILFVASILYSTILVAQWNPENFGNQNSRMSMCVLNSDTVVNIALQNQINRYDGENNTVTSFDELLFGGWLEDLDFPSDEIGYACGGSYFGIYRDVILKTYDSGLTWDTITTNNFDGNLFEHIEFLDVDTGFVVGDAPFLRTFDGGSSFEEISFPQEYVQFTALTSNSASRIFTATRKTISNDPDSILFSIFSSDNYGTSWDMRFTNTLAVTSFFGYHIIEDLFFLNNTHGFAVGNNGLFLKTTDGGTTWESNYISPFTNMNTVFFTSENVGYTNIAAGISKTIDGGETWSQQNVINPNNILQIEFANDSIGYALSYERIYKTGNSGGTLSINEETDLNQLSIFPNPAKDFIQIETPNSVNIRGYKLYDSQGVLVKMFDKNSSKLSISDLARGLYFLHTETDQNKFINKIVLE